MNVHEYTAAYSRPLDHVPRIVVPVTPGALNDSLAGLAYKPTAGLIDLSDLPANTLENTNWFTGLRGIGPEPDQMLYIGVPHPEDSPEFTLHPLRDGLGLIDARYVAVVNLTGMGRHSSSGVGYGSNLNHGLVAFSNAKWTKDASGAWRENGFHGHGFVAAVGNTISDCGTAIIGYGTGGFLVADNLVDSGGDWGREGLSGISFVRLFGNDPHPEAPYGTPPWEDPYWYVYLNNSVTDIRQRVNSTAIGHQFPTDGNGLIIGDSENAPGAVLIERNHVADNDGAGINVYRGPVGGGRIAHNDLLRNWRRPAYTTAAPPNPERWGGEILLQRLPGDAPVKYELEGNTFGSDETYGPATEQVKLSGPFIVVHTDPGWKPEPEPTPEPEPEPTPVPDNQLALLRLELSSALEMIAELERRQAAQLLENAALKQRLDKVENRQNAYATDYGSTEELLLDLAQHARRALTAFETWNGGEIVGE